MDPVAIITGITQKLEDGWNHADGKEFSAPFAPSSDFVDVRGVYHANQSPEAIGGAHEGIFNSIYKGSSIHYEILDAVQIDAETILAHVKGTLNAPSGPLSGINNSTITLVVSSTKGEWKIRAFHNTLVQKS